jgi:hypothetical protein
MGKILPQGFESLFNLDFEGVSTLPLYGYTHAYDPQQTLPIFVALHR